MPNDGGVWVKLEDAGSSAPGAAVINDAASNYDNKDAGVTIDGKTYDIYTFTDDTRDDLSLTVDTPGFVDAIIVGGGGSGGNGDTTWLAGGGGAGGVVEGSFYLDANSHKVIVGAGGAGVPHQNLVIGGYNGESSHLSYVVAVGGGAGAGGYNGGSQIGGSGGAQSKTGNYSFPQKGTPGQGNDGGGGNGSSGGGGGGAGSPGTIGNGGDGKDYSSFIGQPADTLWLAGGGGGKNSGVGGKGGGGNHSQPGTPNTGGGAGAVIQAVGASGGSGIVIVRVEI